MMDEGYRWFLGLVAQRRGIKTDQIPGLSRAASSPAGRRFSYKLVDSSRRRGRGGRVAADERATSTRALKWSTGSRRASASLGLFQLHRLGGSEPFQPHLRGPNAGPRPDLAGLGLDGLISVWHPSENNRLQSFAAGRAMIKSELIHKIANANPHLYHRDVERIVNVVFDEIVEALARGDRVELRGFGAFTVKHRAARRAATRAPARRSRWPRSSCRSSRPAKSCASGSTAAKKVTSASRGCASC